MLHFFDLLLGIPEPAVGVQCADQGITLNSKELLLEEAGSASLTSMISLQLLAFVLGSDMQSLAPTEQTVPLTKDLHWFGMFLTGKQKAFQALCVAVPFCLSCTVQSRLWIEEQCVAVHCFVPKARLVQPDGWKTGYCLNQMDLIGRHEVLPCLLACHLLTLQYKAFPVRKWDAGITYRSGGGWVCGGLLAAELSWEQWVVLRGCCNRFFLRRYVEVARACTQKWMALWMCSVQYDTMHVVLANPVDKPSNGSQLPLTRLSHASLTRPYCLQGWKWAPWSCGAYKSWERLKGSIIAARALNVCNITVLPARALTGACGSHHSSSTAVAGSRQEGHGRGTGEKKDTGRMGRGHWSRSDPSWDGKQGQTLVLRMEAVVCSRSDTQSHPLLRLPHVFFI